MTNRPEFDPERSAAIRSLLVQTAAASAAAPASGHPRRRTIVLVALAVLAGLLASGTAAVALMGDSLFGAPAPIVTTTAPTPTPTPTPKPTPTPTPAPAQPPAPTAPVSRVPSSCDDLLTQGVAEGILGIPLATPPDVEFVNPVFYTDTRIGALDCTWSTAAAEQPWAASGVRVDVYPDVTAAGFLAEANREGTYIGHTEPDLGAEVYSSCEPSDASPQAYYCAYIARVNGYAIAVSANVGQGAQLTAGQRSDVRNLLIHTMGVVGATGAPGPLWEPSGPRVAGADSCDALVDPADLATMLGVDSVQVYQSEEGEYANAHFGVGQQVGAYWCSWVDTATYGDVGASAAVLPGGATYFAASAAATPDVVWVPAPDYPGEAYIREIDAATSEVTVLIDGAWVRVSAPAESLRALTDVVLANVGAE